MPAQPSHLRFRDLNALLIRKRNRQRKGFPWSHRQITRKSPAGTGEAHSVLALKQTSLVDLTGEQTGKRRWGKSRRASGPRREAQFSVEGEGLNREAGLGNTPRPPLLGNASGESIASISGASRCSVLPTLNLKQVLAERIDAQASWSRRRRRANWYEDHDVARARLMIGRIIGRNEVVLDLCWGPDIQTGRLSQRNEERRPEIPRAG